MSLPEFSWSNIKSGFRALAKPPLIRDSFSHIQLEPTNYCNYNCAMCLHKQVITRPRHLNPDQLARIIEMMRPRYVTFSGYGEPLLNSEFFNMVRMLGRRGAGVNTTTNGSLTSRFVDDILGSGLDNFSTSLDAAQPDTYEAIRRKSNFDKVVSDFKSLAGEKRGRALPELRISFVIQERNVREMESFVHLARDTGADSILFQPYIELSPDAGQETPAAPHAKTLFSMLQRARETADRFNLRTNLPFLIKRFDYLFTPAHAAGYDPRVIRRCIKPWFSAYISVEGEVRPCCLFSPYTLNTGSVFDRHALDVLNSEYMVVFRRRLKRGEAPSRVCETCRPNNLADTLYTSVW